MNRLPGPPGALDAAMRAGTTHIYVSTSDDGFVRPGCGRNNSQHMNQQQPPSNSTCRAAGSAGWLQSCGRFDVDRSLPSGPQRVYDARGLAPTWAGASIGWTCGSFVADVWRTGWNLSFPGGAAAAARYNLVDLFTRRGLKILRNIETPYDVMKAGSGNPWTRQPDFGQAILDWKVSEDGKEVVGMHPLMAAFRAALQPNHGFWYDEEWVVSNMTRFPLTLADRQLAEMLRSAGVLKSTSSLNDTTVSTLRDDGTQTDYYQLRCVQTAMLTQMYLWLCRDKYPDRCREAVPYSSCECTRTNQLPVAQRRYSSHPPRSG